MNFAVLGRFTMFRSFVFLSLFFHAKLKFDVDVTGPLQETACCLKSWLWPCKVAYFSCVYPVLCMCFELKFDRSSVTKVQWAMTRNKGNWTSKHQFPMQSKCFASLNDLPALEWRRTHWTQCFFFADHINWMINHFVKLPPSQSEWTRSSTHWKKCKWNLISPLNSL